MLENAVPEGRLFAQIGRDCPARRQPRRHELRKRRRERFPKKIPADRHVWLALPTRFPEFPTARFALPLSLLGRRSVDPLTVFESDRSTRRLKFPGVSRKGPRERSGC